MGAPYRLLQSDFSAGQIDRMVEANLNLSYKTIGLRQSLNTIHNVNKTVSKRPGTEFYGSSTEFFDIGPGQGKADILLPDGRTVMLVFDATHSHLFCEGVRTESQVTIGVDGPYHTAVYQNFLYVVGPNVPLVKIFRIYDDNGTITMVDRSIGYSTWSAANPPSCVTSASVTFSSCMVSGGRLFLSKGNVFWFSRIRVVGSLVEDTDGFPLWTMDFKLSDLVNNNVYVDSSYGFEGRENDMYSSEIKWMANMGRVIIGTGAGIFMSTTQGIDPTTFDTVMTSSYGTSGIQPVLVSNMLFFLSSDRRKIFSAYFSSDYQGLLISDVTANVRDMFSSGIRAFWAFDYPELSVYAVTEDGRMLFCQPSYLQGGMVFAWSEWTLPFGGVFRAVFHERLTDDPLHRICALVGTLTGNTATMVSVAFGEPYNDDTGRALMDFMQTIPNSDLTTEANHVEATVVDFGEDVMMTVFVRSSTASAPIVLRNIPTEDGEISFDVPANVEGFYDDDGELLSSVEITCGIEYEGRIGLFQQILPNNSGIALSSKHNVRDISVMVFRSFGGYIEVAGRKSDDLPYLRYGRSSYSANMYDFTENGVYAYTGVLKITNPRYIGPVDADNTAHDVLEDDCVVLVLDRPFPFNLMAVSIGYIVTEVN